MEDEEVDESDISDFEVRFWAKKDVLWPSGKRRFLEQANKFSGSKLEYNERSLGFESSIFSFLSLPISGYG